MELDELNYFFFDLDKTLWNWDDTIIGAEDLIDSLREADKKVYFHTDNTLLSREEYARKLTSMGIPAEEEDIITSGYVAAKHLSKNDITEVYAIGEPGLHTELEKEGIDISEEADTVIAGFDRQFSYSKLRRVMSILENGGDLYLCSTETSFRTSNYSMPHQGPFNLAMKEFGDAEIIGKPSEIFREEFKEYFSFFPGRSAFVGDRLGDMETGNRLGMTTLAVMSGEIDREKLAYAEDIEKPDFGLSSLAKLRRRVL
ncbi:MAG: HAD-IIA family hydrolase [Candidatus Nanohaloarchaea archaeon]